MKRVMKIKVMLLLLFTTCCLAGINRVPSDYPTIQAAIDASVDGDTVLVAPGTYTGDGNRDIDFKGKAITVKSEEGPQTCIVDCQGSIDDPHRGFFFHTNEEANSILQGFTITNGFTITSYSQGGGIYCENSSPRIENCVVLANTALFGGGIACIDSQAIIIRCIIQNNAADYAGGIRLTMTTSLSSLLTMTNCFIIGNKAKDSGGGIHCYGDIIMTNCFVVGNKAEGSSGGGIYCYGEITLLNCTISGNYAGSYGGGGIHLNSGKISNSIIHGNLIPASVGIEIVQEPHGAGGCRPDLIKITHSVVGSDPNAIDVPRCYSGEWLHAEPLFAQPGNWDPNGTPDDPNDDFWVDGDYHLKSQAGRWETNSESWVVDDVTSPCIDAGDPNSPIQHEPFPNGGIINMGAYGGTAEASKSYFSKPVCETIVAGDINGDCIVDIKDFTLMIAHWLEDHTPLQ